MISAIDRRIGELDGMSPEALDAVNQILNVITYVLAAIYFLVDAGLGGRGQADLKLDSQSFGAKLRAWIRSLPPYPSLALFSVPVIILEPSRLLRHLWLRPVEQHCDVDYRRASQAVLVERLSSSVSPALS